MIDRQYKPKRRERQRDLVMVFVKNDVVDVEPLVMNLIQQSIELGLGYCFRSHSSPPQQWNPNGSTAALDSSLPPVQLNV
jgi:hypothetical protein